MSRSSFLVDFDHDTCTLDAGACSAPMWSTGMLSPGTTGEPLPCPSGSGGPGGARAR